MSVTLKQVAALAGVHPSTVSRVVNKDPRLRISEPKRAEIEALLRQTDYRPDVVARSLKTRQTYVLAMVVPDIANSLFATIFKGLEAAAMDLGYSVLLSNTDGLPERERAHLETLRSRRVDGVVLASAQLRDPSVRWLRERGIPHVLVNRYSDTRQAFVGADNVRGAELAVRHLIELGHRRIAHLAGGPRISTAELRLRGYRQSLQQAGIEPDDRLVAVTGFLEEPAIAATTRLLRSRRPPTAVFAVNDLVAAGAYQAVAAAGLRVPDDVAIVGYNDLALATRISPPLTTLRVPLAEFGRQSARILAEQIASGEPSRERIVFPPELVVRGSTGPVPVTKRGR